MSTKPLAGFDDPKKHKHKKPATAVAPWSLAAGAGDVTIGIIRSQTAVSGWLTDEPATPSAGYGGWQEQSRPHRASLLPWQGRAPFQLTIPLLLYQGGGSVQDDIDTLQRMAAVSATSRHAPPVLSVDGAVLVPPQATGRWVIDDLAWGDQVRGPDTDITRQLVTITLLEQIEDVTLAASTLTDRQGRKTVVRHYHVKKGDTLRSIAARQLGDQNRWVDIAALNGLRSSGNLKPGQTLKLP